MLENSFVFDAISREKFLGIYNKSKKFESLANLNEFIKKKSRAGVFMLCSTLLSLASPFYEDPYVNDQQSFLDRISDKIDGAAISFSFKKFLKSILMCPDNQQLPTFAELKTEYLKSGGTMFSHEDLNMTTQPRSDHKAFNFRGISEFLEKLISSTHSRLDFNCEQDFFDQQVQENEVLKKSTLNIQILDFDKNEFNSNWNSLANSLSANLINNFGAKNDEYDQRNVSNQKENDNPYMLESSSQKKGKTNEPIDYSAKNEIVSNNKRPSKSQFANYKSFETQDDPESRLSEMNMKLPSSKMKQESKGYLPHSKDLTDNTKNTQNPNILNNTSLTEMIKKFACTNSYSESGRETMNNINEANGIVKQQTVSLQNMINDLKANNTNHGSSGKDKPTSGMENQLNGLINLLQSNQVPPNVLKMICDELFFKQRVEGNVFYMPGSNSNIITSQADNNKLNKTHDSSRLELIDLDNQTEASRISCNRRLTFQTDNKNQNRSFSPIPRSESETTPPKLRPSISGENSISKTFDNGKFVSFAPMGKKESQSGSKKETPLYANQYSYSRSNSTENVGDDEVSKSGKLQRRPSFVKNHLTIETEEIKANADKDQNADTNKANEKLLEFENQILTHIQLSPKISVYKTLSMNEWKDVDQKSRIAGSNLVDVENKLASFNNFNGIAPTELALKKNAQSQQDLASYSPAKNDEINSQYTQSRRLIYENSDDASRNMVRNQPQFNGLSDIDHKAGNYSGYSYMSQHRLNSNSKPTEYQSHTKYLSDEMMGEKVHVSHLVNNTNTQMHDLNTNITNTQATDFCMVQPPRSPVSRRVVIETPGVRSTINENYTHLTEDASKVSTIRNASPLRITKVIRRSYTITPDKKIIEHEIPKDNVIEEIIFNDSGFHEVATDMSSYVRKSIMGTDQTYKHSASNTSKFDIPTVTKTSYIRESPTKYTSTSQINTKYSFDKGNDKTQVGPVENFGQTSYITTQRLQSPVHKSSFKHDTIDATGHYFGNEDRSKSPSFVTRTQTGNEKPISNISQYLANEFRGQKPSSNTTTARETQNSNHVRVQRSDLERFYNGERINPVYPIGNQLHSPRNADYFNTLLSTFENFSSVQPLNRSTSRPNINQTNTNLRHSKANPHQSSYLNAYSSRQINRTSPQKSSYLNDYQSNDYRSNQNVRNKSQVRNSMMYPKDGYRSPKNEFKDSSNYFPTHIDGVYTTDPNSPIRSRDKTSQFSSLKTSLNVQSRHY